MLDWPKLAVVTGRPLLPEQCSASVDHGAARSSAYLVPRLELRDLSVAGGQLLLQAPLHLGCFALRLGELLLLRKETEGGKGDGQRKTLVSERNIVKREVRKRERSGRGGRVGGWGGFPRGE